MLTKDFKLIKGIHDPRFKAVDIWIFDNTQNKQSSREKNDDKFKIFLYEIFRE